MIRKNGNFKDMKISHWQLHSLEFLLCRNQTQIKFFKNGEPNKFECL